MSFISYKNWLDEKFTADSDPISDMGIGVRARIEKWLKEHNIYNYTLNDDLTIDVDGPVNLSYELNGNLPDYIKFSHITNGYFMSTHNNMTSLKGSPKTIDKGNANYRGNFEVNNNNLTSLKYAPKKISGNFICADNKKLFSEKTVRKICKVGKGVYL